MFQSKFARALIIGVTGCLLGSAASAHEFVASTSQTDAKPGSTAILIMDSTHQFGIPEEAEATKHVRAQLITTSGKTGLEVAENPDAPNLVASFTYPDQTAWLQGHRLPVVWSQTPDGWLEGGMDQHADAITSARYEKFAKHLIGRSQNDDLITTPLGDKLEIVPLSDPRKTAIGTDAEFQVLLDGQPLTTTVLATYAGFTDTPSSWAYYSETLADERGSGIAKVRISSPGLWVVRVATDVADTQEGVRVHNLRATLSFHVDGQD
ncbi:DUF4198 domain-containing protein [Thalassospira aquimaris]|uniref:DUF4198 domain-containing protein n=1 Tax=Thalassospira aquimaris TaxID=3037796 RepID=A0ABT6G919_9PROT|nr:DUF4198 domain-containing protein [Thalassospira sp. FZY0004]MDG4718259.1 DUF4198 domain-containing protein [Thalassospira sp. FZY0004]